MITFLRNTRAGRLILLISAIVFFSLALSFIINLSASLLSLPLLATAFNVLVTVLSIGFIFVLAAVLAWVSGVYSSDFSKKAWTNFTEDSSEDLDEDCEEDVLPDPMPSPLSPTRIYIDGNINPIFDIDDLSFFRAYGLGLRHTELDLGITQAREGANRGDAVSLANYGVERRRPTFSVSLCLEFQHKLAMFISSSYGIYHSEENHFNDAAFMLLQRGIDARIPYDFHSYPLGKCGTRCFSAGQVMLLIRSDRYNNENKSHAVYNTLCDLKTNVQRLKISKTQDLLNQLYASGSIFVGSQKLILRQILNTMIVYYENNIYIESNIFEKLFKLIDPEERRLCLRPQNSQDVIDAIQLDFGVIQVNKKKEEPVYLSSFSKLKNVLINYRENLYLERALALDIQAGGVELKKRSKNLSVANFDMVINCFLSDLHRLKPEHMNIIYLRMQDVCFSFYITEMITRIDRNLADCIRNGDGWAFLRYIEVNKLSFFPPSAPIDSTSVEIEENRGQVYG
jgi:hypothetical protein